MNTTYLWEDHLHLRETCIPEIRPKSGKIHQNLQKHNQGWTTNQKQFIASIIPCSCFHTNIVDQKTEGNMSPLHPYLSGKGSISQDERSEKVSDSVECLTDTLAQKCAMPPAGIFRVQNDGHGPLWMSYTQKVTHVHPGLPPVSMYHTIDDN
ncbi:uncharacterized protein LOC143803930 [Ranitomeya variabilis]|uniref:uncharacterized protein LOC143803930 n=1 Tax=Ranitomeya variabilis TaxID=490064 RepID=UPI004055FF0E